MLKFLTHKLRTHSINEDNYIEKVDEDHDSGTESDDEIDEAGIPSAAVMSDRSSISPADTADTGCSVGSPVPEGVDGDAELYGDALHDPHSSEEELEVINSPLRAVRATSATQQPEKRKWSQISDARALDLSPENDENNSCYSNMHHVPAPGSMSCTTELLSGGSSGSGSDDEVHSLTDSMAAPVQFRTSPPLEAVKPGRPHKGRSLSPPQKLLHYEVSPRKRSRHARHSHPQRPCLDFEKMQQLKARSVTAWRNGGDHGGELSVFCW